MHARSDLFVARLVPVSIVGRLAGGAMPVYTEAPAQQIR